MLIQPHISGYGYHPITYNCDHTHVRAFPGGGAFPNASINCLNAHAGTRVYPLYMAIAMHSHTFVLYFKTPSSGYGRANVDHIIYLSPAASWVEE